jgi:hypothetical protein
MLEILLAHGLVYDETGRTPLHYAGRRGNVMGAKALVYSIENLEDRAAYINAPDPEGETALSAVSNRYINNIFSENDRDILCGRFEIASCREMIAMLQLFGGAIDKKVEEIINSDPNDIRARITPELRKLKKDLTR